MQFFFLSFNPHAFRKCSIKRKRGKKRRFRPLRAEAFDSTWIFSNAVKGLDAQVLADI
jgi:hypothetical protein